MCKHTHLQPRARTSGLERLQNKVRNRSQGTEGLGLEEGLEALVLEQHRAAPWSPLPVTVSGRENVSLFFFWPRVR